MKYWGADAIRGLFIVIWLRRQILRLEFDVAAA
jgi:hypothetical protein